MYNRINKNGYKVGETCLILNLKGKYTDEKQIKKGNLPKDAVIFKEPNTITRAFVIGSLISLPIIVLISIGLIKNVNISTVKPSTLIYSAIISIILMYVHEIIHALCFPKRESKRNMD